MTRRWRSPPRPVTTENPATYQKDVLPFLKAHCFACHGDGKAKADLSFDKYTDDASVLADRKVWDNVRHMLQGGRDAAGGASRSRSRPRSRRSLAGDPRSVRPVRPPPSPIAGRVTIRRLNRTEYNNTIRDLVGVDFKPADDFPADDVGYGFDNIGDVLSLSAAAAGEVPRRRRGDPRPGDRDRRPAEADEAVTVDAIRADATSTAVRDAAGRSTFEEGTITSAARSPATRSATSRSGRCCGLAGRRT